MEKNCGCWAVLKRGVRGACKSSASRDSVNAIPRTSLVYDAGIVIFLEFYSHGYVVCCCFSSFLFYGFLLFFCFLFRDFMSGC